MARSEEHMPVQRFRAPQDLWDEFGEVAKADGSDRSKELRKLIAGYVRRRRAAASKQTA